MWIVSKDAYCEFYLFHKRENAEAFFLSILKECKMDSQDWLNSYEVSTFEELVEKCLKEGYCEDVATIRLVECMD